MPITLEANSTLGSVHWFDKLSEASLLAMQEAARSTLFAIITSPECVNEAKRLFNTELVFTAADLKGLEYPVVVAYRLFEGPLLKEANRLLKTPEQTSIVSSSSKHRPAAGIGQPQFGPPLNYILTAVTRATQQLIVIQPPSHDMDYLLRELKETVVPSDTFAITLDKQIAGDEEWSREAARQIQRDNHHIARQIFTQRLKKTTTEFEQFLQAQRPVSSLSASRSSSSSSSSSTLSNGFLVVYLLIV